MTLARATDQNPPVMREQTACNLTVRLTWESLAGPAHPAHTFGCVQDEDMARTMAAYAARSAPLARRLVALEVSPDGGRYQPWKSLDLLDVPFS